MIAVAVEALVNKCFSLNRLILTAELGRLGNRPS